MSGSTSGCILIVDDDPELRGFVAATLREAGYGTREASSGQRALRLARMETPALALLDVRMEDMSGYEVCHLLREQFGATVPIAFMSGVRTESYDRVGGLLLGADEYLVKPFSTDELLVCVQRLLRRTRAPAARARGTKLSRRELEVLRLLAAGLSPGEIARDLVLSPKTVSAHVERVYLKLDVQTRAQAVAVAYRDGLVGGLAAATGATPEEWPRADDVTPPRLTRRASR